MPVITHTITRTFVAGGVTEYPRSVTELWEHQGVTLEAGDGTPTNVWTSTKRRWEAAWESPLPAVLARWRTRFVARTTFTVTDPNGATYVATMPAAGGFAYGVAYLPSTSTTNGTTYTLTVQWWEV